MYYNIIINDFAFIVSVKFFSCYIIDRFLFDKVIDLIDEGVV